MPFEFISSEILLQGRAFKIRRDTLKTPDGHETKYEIVEHGGSVVLVPVDDQGNVLFVRQYRHATGQDLLELPAGTRRQRFQRQLAFGVSRIWLVTPLIPVRSRTGAKSRPLSKGMPITSK